MCGGVFYLTIFYLICRLSNVEELTRATMKKLTQGMAEHNKAMAAAKSDEAKDSIVSSFSRDPMVFGLLLTCVSWLHFSYNVQKTQKQNTTTGLRTCNNILAMTKVKRNELFASPNIFLYANWSLISYIQPLHSKTPSFIGDKVINLSWKEATKPNVLATTTATG